jgi:hypothetical protein
VPGLAGVDQIATVLDRAGQTRQRAAHQVVVREELIEARHDAKRRTGRHGRQVLCVEGVAFHEAGGVAQTPLGDQA